MNRIGRRQLYIALGEVTTGLHLSGGYTLGNLKQFSGQHTLEARRTAPALCSALWSLIIEGRRAVRADAQFRQRSDGR